jgi:hypothetical protein
MSLAISEIATGEIAGSATAAQLPSVVAKQVNLPISRQVLSLMPARKPAGYLFQARISTASTASAITLEMTSATW